MESNDEIFAYKLENAAATVNHNILSDTEIQRARGLLCGEEQVLLELNEALAALTAKRDAQEERVRKFRVALAPHKRLAPELLSKIFLYCLPSTNTCRVPPKVTDSPWLLGQVCSRWRAISRTESRLWRQIEITLYDGSRLSRGLSRACELLPPLARLSVAYCGSGDLILSGLLPHLWRIHKLNLRMRIAGYDVLFAHAAPDDFVTLQSVEFSLVDGNDTTLCWTGPGGILKLATQLRQLKVESAGGFPFPLLGTPWGQLTSLDIGGLHGLSTQALLSILLNCHHVEQLDISFLPHDEPSFRENILYLPRLRSLHIRQYLPVAFRQFSVWENLSYLNLLSAENMDSTMFCKVLEQSTSLVELHSRVPAKDAATMKNRSLPLNNLRKLVLINVTDTWVFDTLFVPSLKDLYIQSIQLPLNPSIVRDMLVCSGAELSSFWFESTLPQRNKALPALRTFLDAIPSAVHVNDAHSFLDDAILEDIASGTLLPRLEYLRCWPESQGGFLRMAEARASWPEARSLSKNISSRETLKQAFGLCPVGLPSFTLTHASQRRLSILRKNKDLVCSLYQSPGFY